MELHGYSQVDRAANLAAHAGAHLLLLGPAGTGKSTFARQHLAGFEGAYFETQLSKWSDETILFGPPDLKAMREQGDIKYKSDAGLLGAHWALLDEFPDASDVLLRTMLGILEERIFSRGAFIVKVPLQGVIATANYTRQNEVIAAVFDRFTLAVSAPELDRKQRTLLWTDKPVIPGNGNGHGAGGAITLGSLQALRKKAAGIGFSEAVVHLCRRWAEQLSFSPRREARCAWLMRVACVMRGGLEVNHTDAWVLPLAIPVTPDLAGKQKQLTADIEKEADIARNEGAQFASITAITTIEADTPLKKCKAYAKALKALRAIKPVSDGVKGTIEAHIRQLQDAHTVALRELEVLE